MSRETLTPLDEARKAYWEGRAGGRDLIERLERALAAEKERTAGWEGAAHYWHKNFKDRREAIDAERARADAAEVRAEDMRQHAQEHETARKYVEAKLRERHGGGRLDREKADMFLRGLGFDSDDGWYERSLNIIEACIVPAKCAHHDDCDQPPIWCRDHAAQFFPREPGSFVAVVDDAEADRLMKHAAAVWAAPNGVWEHRDRQAVRAILAAANVATVTRGELDTIMQARKTT